ncbi:hypothetical protein AVEN_266053-1 [Araneus ventricosus]|uniref:Uncharacterized protein n=1 Tax=Araneus ventricosus TaxID=182803 RepID=A0A4Y2LRV9_ARAVE|nr:hypothetical protein AVEN_266053-1 [Araneus ventricosus]
MTTQAVPKANLETSTPREDGWCPVQLIMTDLRWNRVRTWNPSSYKRNLKDVKLPISTGFHKNFLEFDTSTNVKSLPVEKDKQALKPRKSRLEFDQQATGELIRNLCSCFELY